jgi:hypothetical protein
MKEKTTNSLCAGAAGALPLQKLSPRNWKKHWCQHNAVVSMARTITDVKGMSPQKIKNGDTSVGYMRLAALRRQQYNIKARRQLLLQNSNNYMFPHQ